MRLELGCIETLSFYNMLVSTRRRVSVQNLSTTSHHQLCSNTYRRQGVELYFFFQDVPGFGIDLVRQHWQHPPKKRTNTLFPLPFRAVERFFSLSIFLNFSPLKNKPPGNIGLVVAGGPRLSWLWGCCGALEGTTSTFDPPVLKVKKKATSWTPCLESEAQWTKRLRKFGGWKWSLEGNLGWLFCHFKGVLRIHQQF